MERFHHIFDWQIKGMSSRRVGDGGWEWSSAEESLEAAGLWPRKEYIQSRKTNIVEYIANHPIYEIGTGAEQIKLSRKFIRWWDQYLTW